MTSVVPACGIQCANVLRGHQPVCGSRVRRGGPAGDVRGRARQPRVGKRSTEVPDKEHQEAESGRRRLTFSCAVASGQPSHSLGAS